MPVIDLGTLTFVTLVADVNTPPEYTQYNGLQLSIPSSIPLPPLGTFVTLKASGVTVHGSTRLNNNKIELLMTAAVDPNWAKVDAIPGVGGWTDQIARQGFFDHAQYLAGQGITAAALWPGLTDFYNWVRADLVAKGWHT